ncbi:MAG: HupE/UreJ family protein [Planctomycetota bacterium]|nr:MAG: HupE/UreJ family protein [Planctomycetota bacterium]
MQRTKFIATCRYHRGCAAPRIAPAQRVPYRMNTVRPPTVVALVLLLAAPAARAHDVSIMPALAVIRQDGSYFIELRVDVDALALGVAHNSAPPAAMAAALRMMAPFELDRAIERAERTVLRRVRIRFDGQLVDPQISFPDHKRTDDTTDPQPTVLGMTARLFGRVPETAETFSFGASAAFNAVDLTIVDETTGRSVKHLLGPGEDCPPYRLYETPAPDRPSVIAQYMILGFEHILPKGLDHILFVLGLFLLAARMRPLLWQITAFTVAHSVTLALSMADVASLPSRIVEPLIAASIAYVAIENLFVREMKPWRPAVVFAFGLLHGMGFAGVLRELGMPPGRFLTALVSFNVGVEFGQLAVVAAAMLTIGACRSRSWYRRAITVPLSVAIAAIGGFWSIQRTFF